MSFSCLERVNFSEIDDRNRWVRRLKFYGGIDIEIEDEERNDDVNVVNAIGI